MTTTAPTPQADVVAELKRQLKEEQKLRETQEKELAALRPTVDIAGRLFRSTDDVRRYFGDKKIAQIVDAQIAFKQKVLNRQGFDRIKYDDEQMAEFVEEVLQAFVDDRLAGPPEEGWLTRTLKMVAPDGSLRQVIYEGQANNVAGSLADGLLIYERKGFKRTDPFLCPSQDCWEPAAVAASGKGKGKWLHSGYCSQDHFTRTEHGAQPVPGAGS